MYATQLGTDVALAARYLQQNELVAIPTETVYGLAANACADEAVKKVFAVKQRPFTNPLIVHVANAAALAEYTERLSPMAQQLLQQFAPGPLTVLLPANGRISTFVNNGGALTAFRVPAHPLTQMLLQLLPFPLVAPSANRFTTISPTTAAHVRKNFDGQIPYILDGGPCRIGIESTVVGFDGEEAVLYRQGAITAEQLEAVLGRPLRRRPPTAQASPGMLPLHYAPITPTALVNDINTLPPGTDKTRTGLLCFRQKRGDFPAEHQAVLSAAGDLEEAAHNLYDCLHFLDDLKLDALLVEKLPDIGLGISINDRLQKAAHR